MSNFDAFGPIIRVKNQVDPSNNHKKTLFLNNVHIFLDIFVIRAPQDVDVLAVLDFTIPCFRPVTLA